MNLSLVATQAPNLSFSAQPPSRRMSENLTFSLKNRLHRVMEILYELSTLLYIKVSS